MKQKLFLTISAILFSATSQADLIDRGGGMIYDDNLNVTWLQDANYALTSGYAATDSEGVESSGAMSWDAAIKWAGDLEYGGYDDWRLPMARKDLTIPTSAEVIFKPSELGQKTYNYLAQDLHHEMGLLYYLGLERLPKMGASQGAVGEICQLEASHYRCGDDFSPFVNVGNHRQYWGNDPYPRGKSGGYYFEFGLGALDADFRGNVKYAWAVRDGDVMPVSTPPVNTPPVNTPEVSLTDQLVAYYPFEENADDQSGFANDGVANGQVSYVSAAIGNGLKLDGVNSIEGTSQPSFIWVPNSSSLQFTGALTLSYWVRFDGNQRQTSADCSGDIVDGVYGTVLAMSGDRNGFYASESESSSDFGINAFNGGHQQSIGGLDSALGVFRFVTYTILDDNIMLYVDGVLQSSESATLNFETSNRKDLYIGVQINEGTGCAKYWYPLDGVIDELRIYSKALSATEVGALYQLANPVAPIPVSPDPIDPVVGARPSCDGLTAKTCESYEKVNKILDWASDTYPEFLEKGVETIPLQGYWARSYAGGSVYLGSADGQVFGIGGALGSGMYFGELDELLVRLGLN